MKRCSTCLHWCGLPSAYAADCALAILARPAFNTDASNCKGYAATGIYEAAPAQGELAAARAFIAQARKVGPDLMSGYEDIQLWKEALAAYDAAVRGSAG